MAFAALLIEQRRSLGKDAKVHLRGEEVCSNGHREVLEAEAVERGALVGSSDLAA